MNETSTGAVLITGCSSGIGKAAAVSLREAGLTVYASARRVETLARLADRGVRTLALDVTDEQSMFDAVQAVEAEAGSVGVLINNAGYGPFSRLDTGSGARLSSTAEDIAAVIAKAVTARRPRTRYLINAVAKGAVGMKRWLPDRAYDAMLRRQYRLPG